MGWRNEKCGETKTQIDVVAENGHYQGRWNFRVKLALGVVLKRENFKYTPQT
jgi:hypothetical protein